MQQIGKTLPESIVDYVMEVGGINFKIDRIRTDYVTKDELPAIVEGNHFITKKEMQ